MQVTTVPYNEKNEGQDSKLTMYLNFMGWDTEQFTNEKLESMLAASCLRFLEGLTNIQFVLGLSTQILKKQKREMNLSLHYATEILHDLSEKLHNHTIAITDSSTIANYVDDAQEVITSRRYISAIS